MTQPDSAFGFDRPMDKWAGTKNFGKIISVDIDGCIFRFDGWKGPYHWGPLIKGARETLLELHKREWYIVLFTTRIVTFPLIHLLARNCIIFDDINGRVSVDCSQTANVVRIDSYANPSVDYSPLSRTFFWRHNPEFASIKPIASVYLDDMNVENGGAEYTEEKWEWVRKFLIAKYG